MSEGTKPGRAAAAFERENAGNPETCLSCGRPVSQDEIAVTKKLINRGAVRFYCVLCLAVYFEVKPEDILERIRYFRQTGCTLFARESKP